MIKQPKTTLKKSSIQTTLLKTESQIQTVIKQKAVFSVESSAGCCNSKVNEPHPIIILDVDNGANQLE